MQIKKGRKRVEFVGLEQIILRCEIGFLVKLCMLEVSEFRVEREAKRSHFVLSSLCNSKGNKRDRWSHIFYGPTTA